ncbi:MAG: DUF1924 domain-containing protein [Gammaproteobacteria bacterium]|nr:DUF1924 domain-containing protein [Gammaproteobacteria bacterium]
MKSILPILIFSLGLGLNTAQAESPAMKQLLDNYKNSGAQAADFSRGQSLWQQTAAVNNQSRSCTSCHGDNLKTEGKHQATGKMIKAMAPAINPQRLTDRANIEKWFKRNCKWTWGRECTAQEKSDLLIYIDQYASRI